MSDPSRSDVPSPPGDDVPLVPVRLRPDYRRRLWGGNVLPEWLGGEPPPGDEPVAEAWVAHGGSVIMDGPWHGRTVDDLIARVGPAVVGEASVARYGARMPLLAKFLDAADDLSVQVHPNDAYARAHHPGSGHLGKTESWRIVHAEPGARVVWGVSRPMQPERLRRAAEEGAIGTLLRSVPVASGQLIHNPAGTVHAVGAGSRLYELQQASDLTYRLWDYRRKGADGRPRELHLTAALEVADLSGRGEPFVPPRPGADGWTQRVACPFYLLEELATDQDAGRVVDATTLADDGAQLHLLTVLNGSFRLTGQGTEPPMTLPEGATALVPAAYGAYRLHGRGTVLRGRTGPAG
ncbi:MAG: type I phosphomannose isomerase catalytic subunit [Trueperaceae bacterium]